MFSAQHTSNEWQYIKWVEVSMKNLRFQFFRCHNHKPTLTRPIIYLYGATN